MHVIFKQVKTSINELMQSRTLESPSHLQWDVLCSDWSLLSTLVALQEQYNSVVWFKASSKSQSKAPKVKNLSGQGKRPASIGLT